ncbi:hypothetical protein [Solitalea lacus]|uniref:hypothetical protein n=1 Tax=Solitalea lacus TaxID=2911172 RepID=UPI001EDA106A|nr:hypothetical protein [Solitalea lacus]UKJ06351.1 hypothetical protein L2B55_12470 [Solitalea lacus]
MEELRLWLDSYDDIYSDFDSRHYLNRRVSEDFMHELNMALKTKPEEVTDLFLLLPQNIRNAEIEKVIATSLKGFFINQYHLTDANCRKKLHSGIEWLVAGIAIMAINTYIGYKSANSIPLVAIKVLLEPAGWFTIWMSLDFLFFDLKALKKERKFFNGLSEINIHFKEWE